VRIRSLELFLVNKKFRKKEKNWSFVFDVDGVLTDGKFTYTEIGKYSKDFGSHDGDALKMLSKFSQIIFITADKRGLGITECRLQDIGFSVKIVEPEGRVDLIKKLQTDNYIVYVADSFTDCPALKAANLSFTPANAHFLAKKSSNYVLKSQGGSGAVAEVCLLYLLANKRDIF
jgi:3-deoxy-D-manno-octulosonate 8-phosphate phosphatase (KDO 8-P phosphatase)